MPSGDPGGASRLPPAGHCLTFSASSPLETWLPSILSQGFCRRTQETGCTERPLMAAASLPGSTPALSASPALGLLQPVYVKSSSSSRASGSTIPGFIKRGRQSCQHPVKCRVRQQPWTTPVFFDGWNTFFLST